AGGRGVEHAEEQAVIGGEGEPVAPLGFVDLRFGEPAAPACAGAPARAADLVSLVIGERSLAHRLPCALRPRPEPLEKLAAKLRRNRFGCAHGSNRRPALAQSHDLPLASSWAGDETVDVGFAVAALRASASRAARA